MPAVGPAANIPQAEWTLEPASGEARTEQEAGAGDTHQALSDADMFKTSWCGPASLFHIQFETISNMMIDFSQHKALFKNDYVTYKK